MSRVRVALERLYEGVPVMRPAMRAVNRAVKRPTFDGWGMVSHHALPWATSPEAKAFLAAAQNAREQFDHGLQSDTGISAATVDGLLWRHWIVAFATRYAATYAEDLNMVECGVGDGLTAYFACAEAEHVVGRSYILHAFDTWAQVATDSATQTYDNISLERTQRNLDGLNVNYHPGPIPETLDASAPATVDYLSIDLNAAAPTIEALDFFVPRLSSRGVVLFDDYGFAAYEDTRRAVDRFFEGRRGVLMQLPTGQAIWFN
jgi:hypothetical protein